MPKIVAAAVAGGIGAVTVSTAAMGDDGCEGMTCQQPVVPTPDARAVQLQEWKTDLAERWYEKKLAGEPLGDLADDLKAWAEAAGIPGEFDDLTRDSLPLPRAESVAQGGAGLAGAVPSSESPKSEQYTLWMATQDQANDYYCGPATAFMINNHLCAVFYESPCKSADEGYKLTQQNLARWEYLDTDVSGTGLGVNWLYALNGWWTDPRSTEGWYGITTLPSENQYVMALAFDVDRLYPLSLDTYQGPGGDRLVDWPFDDEEYLHYVVGAGYGYWGGLTTYIDPCDVLPAPDAYGYHYDYSSAMMAGLVHGLGMVW